MLAPALESPEFEPLEGRCTRGALEVGEYANEMCHLGQSSRCDDPACRRGIPRRVHYGIECRLDLREVAAYRVGKARGQSDRSQRTPSARIVFPKLRRTTRDSAYYVLEPSQSIRVEGSYVSNDAT